MAHCDEYIELISAAIDGALSPAEQERLEEHLAVCPECKALYEELTAVHTALGDLPPVEVPADLHDRIMKAVAAEQILPLAPADKKKAPIRWQRWLASAAVLAIVLIGTWSWKPWDHTVNNLKPQSVELQKSADSEKPVTANTMPAASMTVAAPEAVTFTDNSGNPAAGASEAAPAPESTTEYTEATEDTLSLKEKTAAFDGVSGEGAADMEAMIAPQMFRSMPETEIGGDSGEPAEVPEATGVPEIQSFMTTAMLPSNEAATPVEMSVREALDLVVERCFGDSGYEMVREELDGDPVSCHVSLMDGDAFVVGGTIVCTGESEECFLFECHWDDDPENPYHYSVNKSEGYVAWQGEVPIDGEFRP